MRPAVALPVLLALVLALGSCAAPRPREVDATATGTTVRLVPEQELVVALDTTGGTGFSWVLQTRADIVLQALGEPVYVSRAGDPRLVGTGGVTTFRFRATKPGTEMLLFTYRRPWEMNLPPARTVRYEVRVEPETRALGFVPPRPYTVE